MRKKNNLPPSLPIKYRASRKKREKVAIFWNKFYEKRKKLLSRLAYE